LNGANYNTKYSEMMEYPTEFRAFSFFILFNIMSIVVGLLGTKRSKAATSSQKCDGANSHRFGLTGI